HITQPAPLPGVDGAELAGPGQRPGAVHGQPADSGDSRLALAWTADRDLVLRLCHDPVLAAVPGLPDHSLARSLAARSPDIRRHRCRADHGSQLAGLCRPAVVG